MNGRQIGVISDTHGLLRPESIEALKGSNLIIHAGDVGELEILEALKQIAPVIAIRGNADCEPWSESLPLSHTVEVGQKRLFVIHDLFNLDLDPVDAGFDCVIFGHSHLPSIEMRNGILFLNPGSAGQRRFNLPVSVAIIEVQENTLKPRLIELTIDSTFAAP